MLTIIKKCFMFSIVLLLTACNSSSDDPNNQTDELNGVNKVNSVNELRINLERPEMEVGETQQLTLTGILDNGKTETITDNITWSVDDYSASINETTGKLEAKDTAVVEVTATFNQITAVKQVVISPSSLQSINLDQISSTTPICQETQLIAMGIYADGSTKDISQYVRWNVEGKDQFRAINIREMAGVSSNKFLISSQFAGSVKITAAYNYDNFYPQNSVIASKDVDITDNILTFEIEDTDRDKSIALGLAVFLRTQTTYNDGSSEFGSTPTWSSSSPEVAKADNYNGTQNNAGVVTTISEGTTTITAECGIHQASTELTVTPAE